MLFQRSQMDMLNAFFMASAVLNFDIALIRRTPNWNRINNVWYIYHGSDRRKNKNFCAEDIDEPSTKTIRLVIVIAHMCMYGGGGKVFDGFMWAWLNVILKICIDGHMIRLQFMQAIRSLQPANGNENMICFFGKTTPRTLCRTKKKQKNYL